MKPSDLERWLSEEEWIRWDHITDMLAGGVDSPTFEETLKSAKEALERLAACRMLLKKQEWVLLDPDSKIWKCLECGKLLSDEMLKMYRGNKTDLHFQDCALAAEIEGYPREVPDEKV